MTTHTALRSDSNTSVSHPAAVAGSADATVDALPDAAAQPAADTAGDNPLSRLLQHPALWRAGQLQQPQSSRPSGFAALDAVLPGGGWPRAGLTELLLGTTGIGELRMLAPLIRALSREEARWVAWINPPFMPYAPALEALGIDLERMLMISPRTHQETVWALEQTSRSGSCSLALAWLDERQLQPKDTRRLQFAAQQGQALTCLFRPETAAATHSMAELRLQLRPVQPGQLQVDVRKRRGGWPVSGIRLQIDTAQWPESVYAQLDAWRRQRPDAALATRSSAGAAETTDLTADLAVSSIGIAQTVHTTVPPVTH